MSGVSELYRFVQDATVYTWTSANEAIDYNSETYTTETIGRDGIDQGSDINRANLMVRVPISNALGLDHIANAQDYPTSLTLFRRTDTTVAVYWKGRVVNAKSAGSEVQLECENLFTSLRRPGLRARYQKLCRRPLYGRGCNLTLSSQAVAGFCTAVTDNTVTVAAASGYADQTFRGGMFKSSDGLLRYVSSHSGSSLVLARAIGNLADLVAAAGPGGLAITLYPGCAHNPTACAAFGNLDNYGGFWWIPGKNPMGGSSIV